METPTAYGETRPVGKIWEAGSEKVTKLDKPDIKYNKTSWVMVFGKPRERRRLNTIRYRRISSNNATKIGILR